MLSESLQALHDALHDDNDTLSIRALQGDYQDAIDDEFFKSIQRNAIRLLKLVNNLLDFAKIEEGQMPQVR